ncbi:MAG: PilZ domain-containing protein [Sphingopyxis sp.]|nr:PilZ domain-containing protein [Sphingopyxis sp.]
MPDQKYKTAIASDTRRSKRVRITARARFREVGANPYEVEIDDLSATGFRMISYTRPRTGTRIWVTLPGLQSLEAVVRRTQGNNHGCEFTQPLHPSVAAHLQSLLKARKAD